MITGICNLMTVSTTSTFSLLWYMFLKKTADFNDPPSSLGPHLILTLPPSPPSKSVVFSPLSGVCLTGSNSISYYCGYFASSIKPAHKDCIFCFWRQFTFMVDLQPSSFFFSGHSVCLNLSYSLKSNHCLQCVLYAPDQNLLFVRSYSPRTRQLKSTLSSSSHCLHIHLHGLCFHC